MMDSYVARRSAHPLQFQVLHLLRHLSGEGLQVTAGVFLIADPRGAAAATAGDAE
jgi:hypothetical protein